MELELNLVPIFLKVLYRGTELNELSSSSSTDFLELELNLVPIKKELSQPCLLVRMWVELCVGCVSKLMIKLPLLSRSFHCPQSSVSAHSRRQMGSVLLQGVKSAMIPNYIQGVPCPRRLGFVDLDLGCSTTLPGQ